MSIHFTPTDLIASLFSAANEVFFLDLDVGQSELTPPGCLSLWKMTTPLLG